MKNLLLVCVFCGVVVVIGWPVLASGYHNMFDGPSVPILIKFSNDPAQAAAASPTTPDYIAMARHDAQEAGINPDLFVRQITVESHWNKDAVSPKGAIGIAQFMPATAQSLGIDPTNPIDALHGAAQLMASYLKRYGGDDAKSLAAYNAGSSAVAYAVAHGGEHWRAWLPHETQSYLVLILGS